MSTQPRQCPRPGCRGQLYRDREDGPNTWTCIQCSRPFREGFEALDLPKPRHRLVDDQWKEAS